MFAGLRRGRLRDFGSPVSARRGRTTSRKLFDLIYARSLDPLAAFRLCVAEGPGHRSTAQLLPGQGGSSAGHRAADTAGAATAAEGPEPASHWQVAREARGAPGRRGRLTKGAPLALASPYLPGRSASAPPPAGPGAAPRRSLSSWPLGGPAAAGKWGTLPPPAPSFPAAAPADHLSPRAAVQVGIRPHSTARRAAPNSSKIPSPGEGKR